ncbi:MAG: hypothetical protein AB2L14_06245 [Candidatus Xenobiia bacterium LiM19]
MWFDIAVIVIVSAVGMSFLARQFHDVVSPSPSPSRISSELTARVAAMTVPVSGGDKRTNHHNKKKSYQLIPTMLRINGVFMGMSSEYLVERFGPALSKSVRNFGEIWRYHFVTLDLGPGCGRLRVLQVWGTELARGRDVLLQAGDSREEVFRVFPDAHAIRPHPPDSNDWRDIYDTAGSNAHVIEDPEALELVFFQGVPYAQCSETVYPETCYLYAVLVNGRIRSINAQHNYPAGKRRFYVNP